MIADRLVPYESFGGSVMRYALGQVKSSVNMLKVFCQFLHGEGDFVRHLKKMGYVVSHVQSYIGKRRSDETFVVMYVSFLPVWPEAWLVYAWFFIFVCVHVVEDRWVRSSRSSCNKQLEPNTHDVFHGARVATLLFLNASHHVTQHKPSRKRKIYIGVICFYFSPPPRTDEFDFHVGNLAVDLRDGVRLTRLMEVVTGEWGLAVGLRVPAVSRLQASMWFLLELLSGLVALSSAAAIAGGLLLQACSYDYNGI